MNLLLFIFIIVFGYYINRNNTKSVNKYNLVIGIVVLLLAGLRNEAIYGDTILYVDRFIDLGDFPIEYIPIEFPKDPTFYIASHYLSILFNGEYTYWLMLISAIYIIPLTFLIKRYSWNPMYSWSVFIFIGLYTFIMAGLRQTAAMGLILLGFLLLMKRKDIFYFLCIVLAYLLHGPALIGLLIYPFVKFDIKLNSKTFIFYVALFGILLVYGDTLMANTIDALSEQDARFANYAAQTKSATWTYFLQQFIIVIPSLYVLQDKLHEREYSLFANLSIIGLIFVSLSPIFAEMFRLSMYFSWADMILFAAAMRKYDKTDIPYLYLIFFFVYLTFINKTLLQEYFFWFEDTEEYIRTNFEWIEI